MAEVVVRDLTKTFGRDRAALSGVSLSIERGEMVALIGASGSGKSTLIRHLAGLTEADRTRGAGEIRAPPACRHQRDLSAVQPGGAPLPPHQCDAGRAGPRAVLARLSLPVHTAGEEGGNGGARARVGIARRAGQRASTLSGGEQQRVAVARALVQKAQIILADEPIASLDPASCKRVMETLAKINREDGITIVVSLHQVDYALRYCPRTIALREGTVVYDGPSYALTRRFLQELYSSEGGKLLIGTTVRPQQSGPRPAAPVIPASGERATPLTIH